jgi:hypothetical protein
LSHPAELFRRHEVELLVGRAPEKRCAAVPNQHGDIGEHWYGSSSQLGDFNRRFNIADDDMWRELDDGDPDLAKHTEGLTSTWVNAQFPEYIDHIVTDTRGTAWVQSGSFEQVLFTTVDSGGRAHLSDHCPISVAFETIGPTEGDAITLLLERLDAVKVELEEIEAGIAALQE